jgi:hypothetical protein
MGEAKVSIGPEFVALEVTSGCSGTRHSGTTEVEQLITADRVRGFTEVLDQDLRTSKEILGRTGITDGHTVDH